MADMFGAPVGVSQAMSDINAKQLADLSLKEGAVKLEQAQLTLDSQKQMLQLMKGMQEAPPTASGNQPQQQGGFPGPSMNSQTNQLASAMDQLARMSLASGLPEKAREYATAGSTIRSNAATIAKNQFDTTIKELNLIGSLMENVKDEVSWRQANALYSMETGKQTPFAGKPYDPRLVDQLRMGVQSAKERALTASAKARAESTVSLKAERETRTRLVEAQIDLTKERTNKLKKAGATQIIPKAGEVRAVTDLITKEYGAGILPEDARVLARPVAERMVQLMKDNNLTASQAANRAYQEAKESGAFGGLRPRPQMKGSADKPLDLPDNKDKLRTNMYYKGKGPHAGKTLLWTGSAFVPVGTGPGEIQPVNEDESEVVDDADLDEDSENPDDLLPAKEP